MSATDELRRLLDERGVEWEDHSGSIEQRTVYRTPNGWCYVSTANDKWLSYVEYHDMTPAQAVEATLGRGTCHNVGDPSDFCCSECGVRMFTEVDETYTMIAGDEQTIIKHPHYCPNCGAKVVE